MNDHIQEYIIYGYGNMCRLLLELVYYTNLKILFIVDKNPSLLGKTKSGIPVVTPDLLHGYCDTQFCITIDDTKIAENVRHNLATKYKMNNEIYYGEIIKYAIEHSNYFYSSISKKESSIHKPKIIFDCITGLGLGGIEAWTKDLCTHLLSYDDFDTEILVDSGEYEVEEILHPIIKKMNFSFLEKGYSLEGIQKIMEHLIVNTGCILVTSHVNIVFLAACIINYEHPGSVRLVPVIHCGTEKEYLRYTTFDAYVEKYLCVSHDISEGIINHGVDIDRTQVITCPVRCDEILDRTYTLNPFESIKLGYAGRIEYAEKRIDLIMKIITELESRKINYRFCILGSGSKENTVKEFISKNLLSDKVFLLKRIPREFISDFWKNQDVYVNISDFEGHSISQMEAMANGAVPVTSLVSGVKEDITQAVNGYYFEKNDVSKAVDYIEYLSINRHKLPEMGAKAHEVMYAKSQMCEHIKTWLEIIRS